MNAHIEWLHRLGASRPRGTESLTPDILHRAGPPPVPAGPHIPDDPTRRFIAVRVIPLLADDNARRALARAKRLLRDVTDQSAVDDARAEAAFWADVRDWARALADEPGSSAGPRPRRDAPLPRQRTA